MDAVYTDFQKAFDKVHHKVLLSKMKKLGFTVDAIGFCMSYFKDPKQYVAYKGYESKTYLCPSGVPQGNNMGPLLFLIFINDITERITASKILLYADDIKLYKSVRARADSEELQTDLNAMSKWNEDNSLSFNIKKCEKITFSGKSTHSLIYHSLSHCLSLD